MGTYSAKPAEVEKKWVMIDAEGLVVGRLATLVAMRLRGKHKPTYTPHVDDGDNVIIVNAAKVVLTGQGSRRRRFTTITPALSVGSRSGRPNQFSTASFPERVLEKAIERMLPRGPLARVQLGNLRVYAGPEHPHAAQNPEQIDIGALNRKNRRSA